jgi:hypothetical protein
MKLNAQPRINAKSSLNHTNMKILNTTFIIVLLLAGIAFIVMAFAFNAYIHLAFGVAFIVLSSAWRKEAKAI